ncbi:hypothetical protein MTE2_4986 [Klebsiella pneumoniae VA360]|nr:hypothetical protein MTE2_4986 [Klebsiella pneumoniae VA360]
MQLIYTVSQTSRWRWLCADVLRKRKAGRNTWRISWKRPNEILPGTRRLSGAITSRPGQKFYSSMNAMSNSISMPFTGAMRQDGGINRR